jgi:hypothetical protein
MKKILVGLIAAVGFSTAMAQHGHHHHHHGSNTGNVILGAVIGSYVIGQIMNQNRPVIVQQPQVIYMPQPVPQQTCEVKFMHDQFGQLREFTTCYYVNR